MKTIGTLLVGAMLLTVTANAFAEIRVWWMRGEGWRTFDFQERVMYVQGVLDGLVFAKSRVQGVKITHGTSLQHMVGALDEFYADYRNELIPVPFALKIVSLEINGATEETVEQELSGLREQFSAADQ